MVRNFSLIILSFIAFQASGQDSFSLEQCINMAFENNISLAQTELDIKSGELQVDQSKASLLPNLNAFGSHGYNWGQTIDPFTNQFASSRIQSNSFGVSTGVTLFSGFALQNQVKLSNLNLEISKLGLESSQNTMALSVANAYLFILFQEEINTANVSNLEASRDQLSRVEKLVNAGQLPEANLYQVQAQVALDESRLIQTENEVNMAYLNLKQLIQLPREQWNSFQIRRPSLEISGSELPSKEAILLHALSNFPEIKSAELGMLNADLNSSIAKGRRLPSLTANFNFGTGFSGANVEGLGDPILDTREIGFVDGSFDLVYTPFFTFDEFQTKPFFSQLESNVNRSLFFSLNIPIFNGLSNKTNFQIAKIGEERAKLNHANVENQLRQTIERAHADAAAAQKVLEASELSLKAQEESFKYAEIRFEQQVINGTDYSLARSTRDAALAEKIRSQYDYIFKLKILEFYQGKNISMN